MVVQVRDCFDFFPIIFFFSLSFIMKIASDFRAIFRFHIDALYARTPKRRPRQLDIDEAIDCLFKLVRTGMQWREVELASASYSTLFKHVKRWVTEGIMHASYSQILHNHAAAHPEKYYIVDSSHVKNAYGREGLGRSAVDRGRKGLKISILTDSHGVVHNLKSDGANRSDFQLFIPMLSSMFIELRRLEVFADRGYDSRSNRRGAYKRGFHPRIMRRRCRNSRKQNGKKAFVEHTFAWIDHFRRLRYQYEHSPLTHVSYTLLALGHLVSRRLAREDEQRAWR